MTGHDDLRERGDVAFAFASALEQGMGDDALLTVGLTRRSVAEVLQDDQVRAVAMPVTIEDGSEGTILFVGLQHFADSVERAASDEILLTGIASALDAASQALAAMVSQEIESDPASEIDLASALRLLGEDAVVYPILEGADPVACLAVAIDAVTHGDSGGAAPTTDAAVGLGAAAAPLVLAEVEMGVTAELGRTHMSVRELLSLTPGAVIDLDRAAGAPVDVLVNGTLIARGEVVVIDEEFGIRISELVKTGAPR
jgi:flagellar motor switch protein FliN/FliY